LKHVLAMVEPYSDFKGRKALKVELEYLRLVYTVSEMRKQGENAQGYFVVIADNVPNQVSKWERDYGGKPCVETITTSPDSYFKYSIESGKTSEISGTAAAAITDKAACRSNSTIRWSIEDFILSKTILALEPCVQRIKDESIFPLGIRWDYYGML